MKNLLRTTVFAFFVILLSFSTSYIFAFNEDFLVDTKTEIQYTTGNDYVTVYTEYSRFVKNSNFYFPASGEKLFHIPDISDSNEQEVTLEREYKLNTLSVTDEKGSKISFTVDKKEIGEGMYISVPNYRTTTSSSPYKIVFTYQTHDYIQKIGSFVNIIGTSLPRDTTFDKRDENNSTLTVFNYYLSIVVDSNIPPLSKAFPAFSKSEKDGKTYYNFNQTDRIGSSPYLEFGTSVMYRFELEYQTSKTDSFIPEKYSSIFKALSTNIYELSLPREFSETKQKVYFENVSPLPKDIYKDSEGNIIALFEVPANQSSVIKLEGYITVKQNEWNDKSSDLDIPYKQYIEKIKDSEYIGKYLNATKYWESNDDYIKQEAANLLKDKITLLDIISANYQYINEKLEYDDDKATSENERIGAKSALLGGPSVCMEYADLMIALLRAQGIPSRAAIGYANLKEEEEPKEQVRHQWVQVWIPDYGWLSVDPTFESNNMKIGQMVDRVLWEVFNNDSLSNIRIYSANDVNDLTSEGYSIKVYGVSDDKDLKEFSSYSDLISKDDISERSNQNIKTLSNTLLKTTTLGKALIITIPILVILVVLIVIIATSSYLIKRFRKRKKII
jgi:transglutaminase-like putative cysteine protease